MSSIKTKSKNKRTIHRIRVVGSLAIDRIMTYSDLFGNKIFPEYINNLNVSFLLNTFKEQRGGTAGNIAYTLALLGEKPEIIASVGTDYIQHLKDLRKYGINTAMVEVKNDESSPCATIITDKNNNQITGFYEGAMKHPVYIDFKQLEGLQGSIFIITAGNTDDMVYQAKQCKNYNIPTVVDIGQQISALSNKKLKMLINRATFCTMNEYEYFVLCDRLGIKEDKLLKMVGTLVVTKDERGCVLKNKKEEINILPCSVKNVVDPTGCGDAYRAGLVKGYVSGCTLQQIGRLASVAASYALEVVGTQKHFFTASDFAKRYKKSYNETCPI